jgi:excisionase family DNA binding protein
MIERLLGIRTSAKKIGIREETLREAIRAGELPVIQTGKRTQRIRPASLEAWLVAREQRGQK